MSNTFDGSITVIATGATFATGAASASTTIPVCSSGEYPRYVRVSVDKDAYIKIGTGAATATANDMLVQAAAPAIIHVPSGYTKIAAILLGVTPGVCNVVPLENM